MVDDNTLEEPEDGLFNYSFGFIRIRALREICMLIFNYAGYEKGDDSVSYLKSV